jgi:hypothetical protein
VLDHRLPRRRARRDRAHGAPRSERRADPAGAVVHQGQVLRLAAGNGRRLRDRQAAVGLDVAGKRRADEVGAALGQVAPQDAARGARRIRQRRRAAQAEHEAGNRLVEAVLDLHGQRALARAKRPHRRRDEALEGDRRALTDRGVRHGRRELHVVGARRGRRAVLVAGRVVDPVRTRGHRVGHAVDGGRRPGLAQVRKRRHRVPAQTLLLGLRDVGCGRQQPLLSADLRPAVHHVHDAGADAEHDDRADHRLDQQRPGFARQPPAQAAACIATREVADAHPADHRQADTAR